VGKTTVNMTQAHIVLPNIEKILNISEESMLQADKLNPLDWRHLNEIWERATSRSMARGIGVDRIVAALKGDKTQQQSTSWSWITGSICLLSGMGIIELLWYKCTNKRTPGAQESQRPSGANSNQPMNLSDVKLQVARSDEMETTKVELVPSHEDDTASQVSPTMFVRPGKAVAEAY
jgi:hypothetical protein